MKVLVVDDEIASLKTLEIFTKKLGYEVLSAKNGQEAYDIWKKETPQLLITDWNMPELSGPDLCKKIKAEQYEDYTYIILVTSRDDINDVITGINSGADDYIIKPFNKDELNVRIKAGERIINFQTKDLVIFALAKLAESRDEDTGQHLERVSHYSKILAQIVKESEHAPPELDSVLIHNIFLTSPLHDIGKVSIPDAILLKPGKLTKEEFEIMKSHVNSGFETLNETIQKAPNATYLRIAAEIALHHHERWDGSGYPDGLKGENIHIASRIFALADVYDALVSKRPYKEPFSHEQATSMIISDSGTHFDPMVIDAFKKCSNLFEEIYQRFEI